jgi:Transposase, Mutator family
MVRQSLVQGIANEPADREIDPGLSQQTAVLHDPEQKARKHQPDRHFGVNPGSSVLRAVEVLNLIMQPAQFQDMVDPNEDMFVRQKVAQRARDKQLQLTPFLPPQHSCLPSPPKRLNQRKYAFSTAPTGLFSRRLGLAVLPGTEVQAMALPVPPRPERHPSRVEPRDPQAHRRRAAHRLERSLSGEGRNRPRRARHDLPRHPPKLAAWLEESVPEGLTVFALPEHHHRRMRTYNPMERAVQQELKRRTVKVRVFPGEDALERLVSAILVEIDEKWASDTKAYIKWECQDA